jgi:hypothetical protein
MAIIFHYRINLLVFITLRKCVYSMVQTEPSTVVSDKFSLQRVKMDSSLSMYDSDTHLLIQHNGHTQTNAVF